NYENTGYADGTWTDGVNGNGEDHVRHANDGDGDDSSYFGANPQIAIAKTTVSSHNSGDDINVMDGEAITWHYEVSIGAGGNVGLSNVTVSDDNGTPLNL